MNNTIRIAILSNFTSDYLAKALENACNAYQIKAQVYNCPYQQYTQEVFNPESAMYRTDPSLTILMLEGKRLFQEWFDMRTLMENREQKQSYVEAVQASILSLICEIRKNSCTRIILNNFSTPYYSPLGILDNKYFPGLRDMISLLNYRLSDWAAEQDDVFIYDYNAFSAYHGEANLEDAKLHYMTKSVLSLKGTTALAREYMRYILPMTYKTKKCLVLDLDNTLWGGVIAEDGISGIKLDLADSGRSFYDFQEVILKLHQRGVLLAVNSKNNLQDAMDVFENHPHMLLRKDFFSVMKINWQDKATNMLEIATELNIGLDSIVFFDDNKVERELVKSILPEVMVVDVPTDTSKYCDTLRNLIEFEQLKLTAEDLNRNAMYAAERRRGDAQREFCSVEEYLKSLGTHVFLEFSNDFTIPRIAQLTQKTNQFNLTTKRYTLENIRHFHQSQNHIVWTIRVTDIYGDNGIAGVCIVQISDESADIDTFLLSCRVMGRHVEHAFMIKVIEILRANGIKTVRAFYRKTEKNKAAADFLKEAGFAVTEENEYEVAYRLDEATHISGYDYIETYLEGEPLLWIKNSST